MYRILGGLVDIRNGSQNCFEEAKGKWFADVLNSYFVYIVEDLQMYDSSSPSFFFPLSIVKF